MKRSQHTHYTYSDTVIYEFKNRYFIIERCQQGKVLLPAHGTRQVASENCVLSTSFGVDTPVDKLGQAAINALKNFDTHPPLFEACENKELNKMLCSFLGARGMASIEKESRLLQIVWSFESGAFCDFPERTYALIPYDNNNINPWYGPIFEKAIVLDAQVDAAQLGAAIVQTFNICTFNPNRCNPKR